MREQDGKLTRLVDERRATLQVAEGKYASLEALQKAALGEGDEGIQEWLENSGLDTNRKVAQTLDVADGWEKAVETVLGDYLQAICVSDITPVTENIAKLRSGHLTILEEFGTEPELFDVSDSLAAKVSGAPKAIHRLLAQVKVAESLGSALSLRESIGDDSSVITVDGIWLGKQWLRVSRDKDSKAGILSREHDMRRLKGETRELKARFESARKLLNDGRIRLNQLEERREAVQSDAASLLNEYSEIKAAHDAAQYRMDQANARQASIAEETGEVDNQQISAEEQLRESRRNFNQAVESLEEFETLRVTLETRRNELRAELQRVREQAIEDRQTVQNITIQFESRRTSKESAAQNLDRMRSQLQVFESREVEIREQLEQRQAPLADNKKSLEEQLAKRITVDEQLASARRMVEEVETNLRDLDQTRMQIDQSVEEARSRVTEAEMGARELRVRREGFAEQLAATDFEFKSLIEEMDASATLSRGKRSSRKFGAGSTGWGQ